MKDIATTLSTNVQKRHIIKELKRKFKKRKVRVKFIYENVSGAKIDRALLAKAVALAKESVIPLAVTSIDRLARNVEVAVRTLRETDIFVAEKGENVNRNDPDAFLTFAIQAGVAQSYSLKQSFVMTKVHAERAERRRLGKRVPPTGAAAHKNRRAARAKAAATNKERKKQSTQPFVALVRKLKKERKGDHEIADLLNEAGMTATWTANKIIQLRKRHNISRLGN